MYKTDCILSPGRQRSMFSLFKPKRFKKSEFNPLPGFNVYLNGKWQEQERLMLIDKHGQPMEVQYHAELLLKENNTNKYRERVYFITTYKDGQTKVGEFPPFKGVDGRLYTIRRPFQKIRFFVTFDVWVQNPETLEGELVSGERLSTESDYD